MSMLGVWWREAEAGQLAEVLQAVHTAADFDYAFLEWWNAQAETGAVPEALAAIGARPADLLSGSLFGVRAEVQFRRVPADYGCCRPLTYAPTSVRFWLALVAGAPVDPGQGWQADTEAPQGWDEAEQVQTFVLWGSQWQGGQVWAELRIPRLLHYPVDPVRGNADGVLLDVVEYRDAAGRVIATRRSRWRAVARREHGDG